jgi:hypothetical protein
MMRKIVFSLFVFIFVLTPQCRPDGLDALVEFGKNQAEIEKDLARETETFERVRDAVESGAIAKGQSKTAIVEECGEPVIMYQDSKSGREKWVYKPAASSFFAGVKIYLFFDSSGALDEINVVK